MTKTRSTKSSLIMSALALFLCFTMLLGTTYAWFTDSVTSAGNKIMSGTLDVDLVDEEGNSLEGKIIEFVTADGRAQDAILWEPGCTYETEPVYVVNKGSLALKYEMIINGIIGNAKLLEAIEWTVTVDGVTTEITDLKGKLLAGETSKAIVLSGHMKEDAGNEYQGLTAEGISITVLATQLAYESDSFNDQYDALATEMNKNADGAWEIETLGQLIYFAKSVNEGTSYEGETVLLTKNIDLAGINWTPIGDADADIFVGFKGTFDGQNFTISNLKINSTSWGKGFFGYMDTTTNATVKNVNFENANVVASDCAGIVVGYAAKGTFENIHVTGDVSVVATVNDGYAGGIAGCGYHADFKNCSVIANAGSKITSAGSFAGGIVGYQCDNTKAITDCKVANLTITGYGAIGGIAGIIQTGPQFAFTNNTVENVVLNKTRVDGNPSIGALVGNYSGTAATTLTGTVSNVTLNGTHVAYSAYNELYGSNYSGATTPNFNIDGVSVTGITNNLTEITLVNNAAALATAMANGGTIVLGADITDVNANTAITVASGKEVTLDLNGHKISSTANKSGNQELFLVKGTMTVKNGSLELIAENNQGWSSMATLFDVTAGGVLNMYGVSAKISGTDMNFIVHLNNWGSATLNVDNCDFTASYVAVRAFNSGYDMNTVTIKNTDSHSGRMFWVHNYTAEGKDDSTLTLDIYGNNNTCDNAKPIRFGFSNSVYYDLDGSAIN